MSNAAPEWLYWARGFEVKFKRLDRDLGDAVHTLNGTLQSLSESVAKLEKKFQGSDRQISTWESQQTKTRDVISRLENVVEGQGQEITSRASSESLEMLASPGHRIPSRQTHSTRAALDERFSERLLQIMWSELD